MHWVNAFVCNKPLIYYAVVSKSHEILKKIARLKSDKMGDGWVSVFVQSRGFSSYFIHITPQSDFVCDYVCLSGIMITPKVMKE